MRRTLFRFAIVVILFSIASPASAAEYWVDTGGSDANSGTKAEPFGTINHAVDQLSPGDTLYVGDGTYDESVNISSSSGTKNNPIRIEAANDGQAVVDGNGARHALVLHANWVVVKGMVFKNGSNHAVVVGGNHNVLRRVSAYFGGDGYNATIHVPGRHNLLEDVIGAGATSHVIMTWSANYQKHHNTYRRVFAYGGDMQEYPHGAARSEYNIYGGSNITIENCIGWGGTVSKSLSVHSRWNKPGMAARDNKVLGSIFLNSQDDGITMGYGYNSTDTLIENTVVAGHDGRGLRVWGGYESSDETIRNVTAVDNGQAGVQLTQRFPDKELRPQVDLSNAIVANNAKGFDGFAPSSLTYTDSWGNSGSNFPSNKGAGCFSKDPKLPDDKPPAVVPSNSPCKGAGSDGDDMGANVRYRYVDGKLTDKPLWPWPMQDRIENELGFDVTGTLAPKMDVSAVDAAATPTSDIAPAAVGFEATVHGDTDASSFRWTFGDGSSAKTGQSVRHTYTSTGTHTAEVDVELADGETLTGSVDVEILDRPRLEAVDTSQAPSIDGRLDDTAYADANPVTYEASDGSSDNEADARAAWDEQFLYLGVAVTDANVEVPSEAMPWKVDGVEFAVDPAYDRSSGLNADDRKLVITADDQIRFGGADGGEYWSAIDAPDGLETATTEGDGGYTVEVAVPWSALSDDGGRLDRLGLFLANNDRDDDSATQFTWHSATDFVAPDSWGALDTVESDDSPPSRGDAGMRADVGTDADTGSDAGHSDDTSVGNDAGGAGGDAADAATSADPPEGGCACRSTSGRTPRGLPVVFLTLIVWLRRRR